MTAPLRPCLYCSSEIYRAARREGWKEPCPVCGATPSRDEISSEAPVGPLSPFEADTLTHLGRAHGGPRSPMTRDAIARLDSLRHSEVGRPPEKLPQIPGYELLGLLGEGGMGVVYQARDVALKRLVALKMIKAAASADYERRARMRAEAEAVARLRHPNIVQIYEIGEHHNLPFCVLEHLDGGSLDRLLAGRPLPALQAARLVELLARALHQAHELNLIHRDFKPGNVLLQQTQAGDPGSCLLFEQPVVPKVSDFGLAKFLDEKDAGMTRDGAILGTPAYMAPEQASGRSAAVGPTADVYALGAVLYECLTGRPPFTGSATVDLLARIQNEEAIPVRQLERGCPGDLETICLKCLEKDPRQRYPTAQELAEELARVQAGEPIRARPVSAWGRVLRWAKRKPAQAALAAVSTLAAVTVLVTFIVSDAAVRTQRNETEASNRLLAATNDELTQERAALATAIVDLTAEQRRSQEARQAENRTWYLRLIAGADAATHASNLAQAETFLNDCRPRDGFPDLRGWEWRLLARRCRPQWFTVPPWGGLPSPPQPHVDRGGLGSPPHGASGSKILARPVFSPDGKTLFEINSGKVVSGWALAERKQTFAWKSKGHVLSVAPSPDGRRLAIGTEKGAVLLDLETQRETPLWNSPLVYAVCWSPDGTLIAASGAQAVEVFDAGSLEQKFRVAQGGMRKVALWQRGTEWLLLGSSDGVEVFGQNLATGEKLAPKFKSFVARIAGEQPPVAKGLSQPDQAPLGVSVSPQGTAIAIAGQTLLRIMTPGGPVHPVLTLPEYPRDVAVSDLDAGGVSVAVAFTDGSVRVWRSPEGKETHRFLGHERSRCALACSADGTFLAATGQHKELLVWCRSHGPDGIYCDSTRLDPDILAVHPSGDRLAALVRIIPPVSPMRDLHLIPTHGLAAEQPWPTAIELSAAAFHPHGDRLATGERLGLVALRAAESGDLLAEWRAHNGQVLAVGFLDPDGKRLVSVGEEWPLRPDADGPPRNPPRGARPTSATARVWDTDSRKELLRIDDLTTLVGGGPFALSANGRFLAAAPRDRKLRVWDLTEGSEVARLNVESKPTSRLAIDAAGRRLFVSHSDGPGLPCAAEIHDVTTGAVHCRLASHPDQVTAAAFAPLLAGASPRLATGGRDRMIRIWDAATGEEILTLQGHAGEIARLAWTPDGRRLISTSRDGQVRVWDGSPAQER